MADDGYGFYGTLTEMDTYQAYKTNFQQEKVLTFTGMPVTLPMSVTLSNGWNWLSCPYVSDVDLGAHIPTGVTYAENDLIKSQTDFATFYGAYGWYGTLTLLEPGKGYKIQVATGNIAYFPETTRRQLATRREELQRLESW